MRTAPAVGMKQRNGMEVHYVVMVLIHGGYVERVEIEVAMGEHDALGRPGAAAGIEKFRHGVLVIIEDVGALGMAGGEKVFVDPIGAGGLFGIERHEELDAGAKRLQLFYQGREIVFKGQDAGAGVIQNGDEFGRRQAHIQRHHNGLGLHDAVVALQQLVVVEAEVGDAVAGLNTGGGERGGQAAYPLAELTVSELAGAANNAEPVTEEVHGAVQAADGG